MALLAANNRSKLHLFKFRHIKRLRPEPATGLGEGRAVLGGCVGGWMVGVIFWAKGS